MPTRTIDPNLSEQERRTLERHGLRDAYVWRTDDTYSRAYRRAFIWISANRERADGMYSMALADREDFARSYGNHYVRCQQVGMIPVPITRYMAH